MKPPRGLSAAQTYAAAASMPSETWKDWLTKMRAYVRDTIFVMNAPEANVTSIYLGQSAAPPAMLLESPFITPDGAVHVPDAEDLHEAMYCAVIGSTEKEQEESGRCLPD